MSLKDRITTRIRFCVKCGAEHAMGIEDMETGNVKQLDMCRDCLFFGSRSVHPENQIIIHPLKYTFAPKFIKQQFLMQEERKLYK